MLDGISVSSSAVSECLSEFGVFFSGIFAVVRKSVCICIRQRYLSWFGNHCFFIGGMRVVV